LKPDAAGLLEPVAKTVRERWKSGPVIVAGYIDSIGSDSVNYQLSLDRAKSVVKWLQTNGKLTDVPFDVQGHGKENPVCA
jgi:outer membrane protein OmpA-like peptidoglycan-associated protein